MEIFFKTNMCIGALYSSKIFQLKYYSSMMQEVSTEIINVIIIIIIIIIIIVIIIIKIIYTG